MLMIVAAVFLSACEPARNTPDQQAEDFKVCASAGMSTYQTGYGEIKCAPPAQGQQSE